MTVDGIGRRLPGHRRDRAGHVTPCGAGARPAMLPGGRFARLCRAADADGRHDRTAGPAAPARRLADSWPRAVLARADVRPRCTGTTGPCSSARSATSPGSPGPPLRSRSWPRRRRRCAAGRPRGCTWLGLQGAAAKLVAVASVTFTTPAAVSLAAAPAMAAPAAFQAHARPVAAGAADLRPCQPARASSSPSTRLPCPRRSPCTTRRERRPRRTTTQRTDRGGPCPATACGRSRALPRLW